MLAPARQGISAEGYQVRDSGGFLVGLDARGRVPEGNAPPGTQGGDRERKLVTVSYSFTTGKRERAVERTVTREMPGQSSRRRRRSTWGRNHNFAVGTGSSR